MLLFEGIFGMDAKVKPPRMDVRRPKIEALNLAAGSRNFFKILMKRIKIKPVPVLHILMNGVSEPQGIIEAHAGPRVNIIKMALYLNGIYHPARHRAMAARVVAAAKIAVLKGNIGGVGNGEDIILLVHNLP